MTQCERILLFMKECGGITSLDAMQDLGVMRLASRVSDLRKMGYSITAKTIKGANRYGETIHYKKYFLEG